MRNISGIKTTVTALVIVALVAVGAVLYARADSNPKQALNSATKTQPEPTKTEPAPVQDTCLQLKDIRTYAYKSPTKVAQDTQFSRVYFEPDSTAYNSKFTKSTEVIAEEEFEFYQKTSAKDYQFTITASTSESSVSESGQQLAEARASKVRDEMIARGIPSERITILPAVRGLAGGDLTRYVYMGVRVPPTCVTQ